MKRAVESYLLTICLLLFSVYVNAQNPVLETKVTINVSNEKTASVLLKIGNLANVDFSYNPDAIPMEKRISLKAKDRTLISILKEIAPGNEYEFKVYGRQIQIIKKKPSPIVKKNSASPVLPASVKPVVQKPAPAATTIHNLPEDTTKNTIVAKRDSVLVDTLVQEVQEKTNEIAIEKQKDTVAEPVSQKETMIDTLAINRNMEQSINKEIRKKQRNLKKIDLPLYAGAEFSAGYPMLKFTTSNQVSALTNERINTSETPVLAYAAGFSLGTNRKHVFMQTGLNYASFAIKTDYQFNEISTKKEPYYIYSYSWKSFRVDSFYVLKPLQDTIWRYIIDSTQLVHTDTLEKRLTDTSYYAQSGKNTWSYYEIPFMAGWNFQRKRITYMLGAGITTGFLHTAKGSTLSLTEKNSFTPLEQLPQTKVIWSYLLRAGMYYHVNAHVAVHVSAQYKGMLHSMYQSAYPADQRLATMSVQAGVTWFFSKIKIASQ